MEFAESTLAMGKLALVFGVMALLLRFRLSLWLIIGAACLVVALTCGIAPRTWPGIVSAGLLQKDFLILCVMLVLIMTLSGLQESTGQSKRLVRGVERYLRWPRIRLIIFPALVGLLPMPGGALFSCPMIKAAADGMGVSEQKKTLINYWFRHIWEVAWPLYPGFILLCSILDLRFTALLRYTFPLVALAFMTGWYFYMRDLSRSQLLKAGTECPLPEDRNTEQTESSEISPLSLVYDTLPLTVTLVGAGVFSLIFERLLPEAPSQCAFLAALLCAVAVALYQGRGRMTRSLPRVAFSKNTGKILLLITAIFLFKQTVAQSDLLSSLNHLGTSDFTICLLFMLVPFIAGMLTGIMVGFIGVSFPILLGILEHSPLKEYTTPLIILAMVAGNCGQMLSPLHVCLVVSCEYFNITITQIWRQLLAPVAVQFGYGIAWALILYAMDARF